MDFFRFLAAAGLGAGSLSIASGHIRGLLLLPGFDVDKRLKSKTLWSIMGIKIKAFLEKKGCE